MTLLRLHGVVEQVYPEGTHIFVRGPSFLLKPC